MTLTFIFKVMILNPLDEDYFMHCMHLYISRPCNNSQFFLAVTLTLIIIATFTSGLLVLFFLCVTQWSCCCGDLSHSCRDDAVPMITCNYGNCVSPLHLSEAGTRWSPSLTVSPSLGLITQHGLSVSDGEVTCPAGEWDDRLLNAPEIC